MFSWFTNLFMASTADAALEAAVYSAGLASHAGMHQSKEPESLQDFAKEYKAKKDCN